MDSSYNSLHCHCQCQTPRSTRRSRSPRLFASVKGLVHRSPPSSISQNRLGRPSSTDSSSKCTQCSPRPASSNGFPKQTLWERRRQTPGMDDYLTLAQLENAWQEQDTFIGYVEAPQNITRYAFTEAAEAPLIAKSRIEGPIDALRPPIHLELQPLHLPNQDETLAIDGAVHPALRSTPYLPDEGSNLQSRAFSGRYAVAVPSR